MTDVFGAMLIAALEDPSVPEVTERDDGFINTLRAARYFDGEPLWPQVDRWALDQCQGRVLDVGAGGGRAALAIQERGHDVVALDSSEGAVDVCHQRGVRETAHGTLDSLEHLAGFDTYLFFGNNLGLLESVERGREVLHVIGSVAQPGAVIVGTSVKPEMTSNPVHLRYHQLSRERGRLPGQLRIRSRYRDQASDWFDYLLLDPNELDELLRPTAWRRSATFEENESYATVLSLGTP